MSFLRNRFFCVVGHPLKINHLDRLASPNPSVMACRQDRSAKTSLDQGEDSTLDDHENYLNKILQAADNIKELLPAHID